MDETPQDMAAEIEASLNTIPFHIESTLGQQPDWRSLTGTCQFTLTGLGSWLLTYKEGMATVVRCEGLCVPPPDATITWSPENYLRLLKREGGLNAETAMQQGLVNISGDEGFAAAALRMCDAAMAT